MVPDRLRTQRQVRPDRLQSFNGTTVSCDCSVAVALRTQEPARLPLPPIQCIRQRNLLGDQRCLPGQFNRAGQLAEVTERVRLRAPVAQSFGNLERVAVRFFCASRRAFAICLPAANPQKGLLVRRR